jgi:hypothetical protein
MPDENTASAWQRLEAFAGEEELELIDSRRSRMERMEAALRRIAVLNPGMNPTAVVLARRALDQEDDDA